MFKEKKDWERVLQQLPADKVNKRKSLAQIDAKFEEKHPTDLSVQVDRQFSWLLLDADSVSYCHICKKYHDFADQIS